MVNYCCEELVVWCSRVVFSTSRLFIVLLSLFCW